MKKYLLAIILTLICVGASSAKQTYLTCDPYPPYDNVTSFTVIANGTVLPDSIPVKDTSRPEIGTTTGGMCLWVEVTANVISGLNTFSVVTNGKYNSSTPTVHKVDMTAPKAPGLRCITK